MAYRSEELQPVTSLTNDLNSELKTSYRKIDKITDLLKKIGYHSNLEFEGSSQQQDKESTDTNGDEGTKVTESTDDSRMQRVKNENLQLLMDIQREEYIGRKWRRILEQNEDIFNSLGDWIKMNLGNLSIDALEIDARAHLRQVKYSKKLLADEIKVSEVAIDAMAHIIQELRDVIESEIHKKEATIQDQ
jgi:hypothetical protein